MRPETSGLNVKIRDGLIVPGPAAFGLPSPAEGSSVESRFPTSPTSGHEFRRASGARSDRGRRRPDPPDDRQWRHIWRGHRDRCVAAPGGCSNPARSSPAVGGGDRRAHATESNRWCDGSDDEWDRLTRLLEQNGTFTRLNPEKRPNSFYARSDPSDVARVEDRTYICSAREIDAGPTNNWLDPQEMRGIFCTLFDGCMRGRPCTSSPSAWARWAHRCQHSASRSPTRRTSPLSMRTMTRMGKDVPRRARRRRVLRALRPLRRRTAGAGAAGRPLAMQLDEVHQPLSRDAGDLVVRLRLVAATPCSARSATRCE